MTTTNPTIILSAACHIGSVPISIPGTAPKMPMRRIMTPTIMSNSLFDIIFPSPLNFLNEKRLIEYKIFVIFT